MKTYSIGELARLSGISVRRIRFYSDRGLLPPTARTMGNYRLYTEVDIARLDLIRALRTAGIDMALIAKVIERRLPLKEVLAAHLEMLESEIAAKRKVAAGIYATLCLPTPTDSDLRRLSTVMNISNEQMRARIEAFFQAAYEGMPDQEENCQQWIKLRSVELPDKPSAEFLDAWEKYYIMLGEDELLLEERANLSFILADTPDRLVRAANWKESAKISRVAETLWANGLPPDSPEVNEIIRALVCHGAKVRGRKVAEMIQIYFDLHELSRNGRLARFVELGAILEGEPLSRDVSQGRDYMEWEHEAMKAILPEFS